MRMRRYPRTVLWTSSSRWGDRPVARGSRPPSRITRLRWCFRVGVLFTVIGLRSGAKIAWTSWPKVLQIAGGAIIVAGILLPSAAILIPGIVLRLAGVLIPVRRETATDPARRVDAALVYRR